MSEELELNDAERLFIAQAFYAKVGAMVSTKDPDNLRGRVAAGYTELYEQTGAKSFDAKVCGQKVGTFSLTVSKPKDSATETQLAVTDADALLRWAVENGCAYVDMKLAEEHFRQSGEVPDGCEVKEIVIPADEGGKVTRTTLRIDSELVARALGPQLETVSYALLEEGGSD